MVNIFSISTGGIIGLVVVIGVALLIIILVVAYIKIRNSFVALGVAVDERFSSIDVYLKKRYDLIPNLVETVKGYSKHEKETLEGVIALRSKAMSASGDARVEAENQLSAGIRSIFAVAERYPELKADRQFMHLSDQLQRIENELVGSRSSYNAVVKAYNIKIDLFPSNIVAKMMKLERREFFETNAQERQNVRVSF